MSLRSRLSIALNMVKFFSAENLLNAMSFSSRIMTLELQASMKRP